MIGGKKPVRRDWASKRDYQQEQEQKKKSAKKKFFILLVLLSLLAWLAPKILLKQDEGEEKTETPMEPAPKPKVEVSRKNIYDRNLQELAVSFKASSVYVKPLEFDNIEKTVSELAGVVSLDEKKLLEELKTQRGFKWLVKNLPADKEHEIRSLELSGVYFYEEEQRFYPSLVNSGHVIGEVKDGHGLSGIESHYDNLLLGSTEKRLDGEEESTYKGPGKDIILTLDMKLQKLLEQEMSMLLDGVRQEGSLFSGQTGVSALVLEGESGEILAYAEVPFHSLVKGQAGEEQAKEGRMFFGKVQPGKLAFFFEVAAAYDQGRTFVSQQDGVPRKIKFLVPRVFKKRKAAQAKPEWVLLGDGSYVSSWLSEALASQAIFAKELTGSDSSESSLDLDNFFDTRQLCKVDLPGTSGDKESPVCLLNAFAGLVNGGRVGRPHFLKGTISETGTTKEWPWPHAERKIIGEEASRSFVRFLREISPPASSVMVAEILYPSEEGVAAMTGLADEKPENRQAQGGENIDEQGGKDAGDHLPVMQKCESIALAAAPLKKPELVMLVLLENGTINLAEQSPVKRHVASFLNRAVKVHRKSKKAQSWHATSESLSQIKDHFLLQGEPLALPGDDGSRKKNGFMVDLRGMSLRKALQELHAHDVKVVIEGSGRVKRQFPAPGSKLSGDTVVVLQAEADL